MCGKGLSKKAVKTVLVNIIYSKEVKIDGINIWHVICYGHLRLLPARLSVIHIKVGLCIEIDFLYHFLYRQGS